MLKSIDFSQWKAYGENLTSCTPGKFKVPNPIVLGFIAMTFEAGANSAKKNINISKEEFDKFIASVYMDYQISGWDANHYCHVLITLQGTEQNGSTTMKLNCAFPKDNLATIAQSAESIATGSTKELTNQNPVSKMMKDYCKTEE